MHTEAINHDPALTFFQTGAQQGNRPSMGSWLSYGLGSENKNLPAFCVLLSRGKGNGQGVYSKLWTNGFFDSIHQGVQFSSGENPVLYLNNPEGIDKADRRKMLDKYLQLNELVIIKNLAILRLKQKSSNMKWHIVCRLQFLKSRICQKNRKIL